MRHLENIKLQMIGHLKMITYDSEESLSCGNGKVIMNRRNAVDKENAALMFARAITDRPVCTIYYMAFGNGGATVDPLGNVILNPPITTGGPSADLYNPLFNVIVDSLAGVPINDYTNLTTGTGSETYSHTSGTEYSYVTVNAVIAKNEPFGQLVVPAGGAPTSGVVTINEIGLKLSDGTLVTHVTFTPIEKEATLLLQIIYTLKISLDVEYVQSSYWPLYGQEARSDIGLFAKTPVTMPSIFAQSQIGYLIVDSISQTTNELLLHGVTSQSEFGNLNAAIVLNKPPLHGVSSQTNIGSFIIDSRNASGNTLKILGVSSQTAVGKITVEK